MKRIKAFFVTALAILMLSACGSSALKEPVTFYYRRAAFHSNAENSVIASEYREATGHQKDLWYLLTVYLAGPLDSSLRSPFPSGTKLLNVSADGNNLVIELSNTNRAQSDAAFSLACACLTKTCLALTDAETVTVISGSRTLTTSLDALLLFDESILGTETEIGEFS